MEVNRLDVGKRLAAADLSYWYALSRLGPVPALNAIELLAGLASDCGPDIGAKIVDEASLVELGFTGVVPLGARTPTEALQRVCAALALHSSQESVRLGSVESGITLSQSSFFDVDPANLHAVRVQLALELIGSDEVSIADPSQRLGYSKRSALTRAMRRLTGRTPSQLKSEAPAPGPLAQSAVFGVQG